MRLFGFLRPGNRTGLHALASQVEGLGKRLEELEATQVRRELEWRDVSEKLLRYLQRIQAVEQRAKQREEGPSGDGKEQARALLMRTKFGNHQGG